MKQPPDISARERLLAELARREAGEPGTRLPDVEESTIAELKAEFDTLVADLRTPKPADDFDDESGCERAIELVDRIGREESFSPSGGPPSPRRVEPELTRLGPYELMAKLGQGGMGSVYRAVHPKLKRDVAIKVLPAHALKNETAIARFEREMEAIGAVNHPNIVAAHDAGEVDGMHYLVMEYVDGLDVSALVRRVGSLAPADACEIIRQAARGLAAAYDSGIVHRDVKPSNLMLADSPGEHAGPQVKILDFGLARLAPMHAAEGELTASGLVMGTLRYMAPEQCAKSNEVDCRADIYSLGATLYKLLCGVGPYSDERYDSPLALLTALGSEEPMRLTARRKDVPPKLEAIVHRMMAKNPADRFTSPGEVVKALEPWTEGANLAALLRRARHGEEQFSSPDGTGRPIRTPAPTRDPSIFQRGPRFLMPVVLFAGGALLAAAGILLTPRLMDEPTHSTPAARDKRAGEPASSVPTANVRDSSAHSRNVAEWLLSERAQFGVTTLGRGFVDLQPGHKLPEDFIQLIAANLEGNKTLANEDFARFDKLPLFTTLGLGRTNAGNEGLQNLGALPLLQHLYLAESVVGDSGLKALARYPKLEVLHLYGTQVTDAGLVHLSSNRALVDLSLVGCSVTDEGLKHLTHFKRLKILALDRTGVTPRGVAMMQRALPDCEVRSDYSAEELSEARQALLNEPK